MALAAGATANRISFGNTIKKERDIARAHALGISLYAIDCFEEVEKLLVLHRELVFFAAFLLMEKEQSGRYRKNLAVFLLWLLMSYVMRIT
ncbi:Pyridoxal-dependent decarboxylase, pyridoxal binding domain [Bartonella sp. Coyote22sub2]|nr:Pyridoxal-dependent decarboxylase, pyridoxal binding domain [Bartonella sp. Coyote22sub2]